MLKNGKIPKKKSTRLRLDLVVRKKIDSRRRDLCKTKKPLALTHWVGTPKIGEHHPSQDIHSVLHSGGVKIKISGIADPTPSL
jgi:hypothetical protein